MARLSKADLGALYDAWMQALTVREAAKVVGCSPAAASENWRRMGLHPRAGLVQKEVFWLMDDSRGVVHHSPLGGPDAGWAAELKVVQDDELLTVADSRDYLGGPARDTREAIGALWREFHDAGWHDFPPGELHALRRQGLGPWPSELRRQDQTGGEE